MSTGFVLENVPHNTREPPGEATEDRLENQKSCNRELLCFTLVPNLMILLCRGLVPTNLGQIDTALVSWGRKKHISGVF